LVVGPKGARQNGFTYIFFLSITFKWHFKIKLYGSLNTVMKYLRRI
jgi:hypothetical protein